MNCQISIIISVYQSEQYLRECLDSIRAQTFSDYEVICVDDGSTDRSGDILREYALLDARLSVISHDNRGGGASRNIALEHASGKYIYFMDPDDCLHRQALECVYHLAEKYEVDVVGFSYRKTGFDPVSYHGFDQIKFLITTQPLFRMQKRNFRFHRSYWSKLYRKSILGSHRFITYPEPGEKNLVTDFAHTICIAADRPSTLIINEKLYYHRYNPTSISKGLSRAKLVKDSHYALLHTHHYLLQNGGKNELRYFKRKLLPHILRGHYKFLTDKTLDHSGAKQEIGHALCLELSDLAAQNLLGLRDRAWRKYLERQRISAYASVP